MRAILPHSEILLPDREYNDDGLDRVIKELLDKSERMPCTIELFDDDGRQHFLFLRAKQIYAAGKSPWLSTTVREFFQAPQTMRSPRMAAFGCDSRLLHSVLIPFQKKPELQVDTALADLDELLNQSEAEGRSSVVLAEQGRHIAILRYEKGHARGLYLNPSLEPAKGDGCREEFLVRVYTLSAQVPVAINLYSDLRVKYADDAKPVSSDHAGSISSVFLARPPILILKFKDKEIRRYNLDRKRVSIGRSAENDIQIDNLGVSRTHCFIEEHRGHYYVIDNESLNGTLVNGQPIKRYCLAQSDVITIGKHTLTYRVELGVGPQIPVEGLEQTMFMTTSAAVQDASPGKGEGHPRPEFGRAEELPLETPATSPGGGYPRLRFVNEKGEEQFALEKDIVLIGSAEDSDIRLSGFLVPATQAQIRKYGSHYVLEHVKGIRKTRANGSRVKKHVLQNNDHIQIANREFIYQE